MDRNLAKGPTVYRPDDTGRLRDTSGAFVNRARITIPGPAKRERCDWCGGVVLVFDDGRPPWCHECKCRN